VNNDSIKKIADLDKIKNKWGENFFNISIALVLNECIDIPRILLVLIICKFLFRRKK